MPNHNRIAADGNNRTAADANNRVTAEVIGVYGTTADGFGLAVGTASRSRSADIAARVLDAETANRSVN